MPETVIGKTFLWLPGECTVRVNEVHSSGMFYGVLVIAAPYSDDISPKRIWVTKEELIELAVPNV